MSHAPYPDEDQPRRPLTARRDEARWQDSDRRDVLMPRRRLWPWLALLVVVAAVAGGGYYAFQSGMFGATSSPSRPAAHPDTSVVIFAGEPERMTARPGNVVEAVTADGTPAVRVRSTTKVARPGGQSDGVSVQVPADVAAKLEGQRIRVVVSASGGELPASFALAYSVDGVGTSGWIVFNPAAAFDDFSFSLVVPRSQAGTTAAHYVNIWGDIAGGGTPLVIRKVTVAETP